MPTLEEIFMPEDIGHSVDTQPAPESTGALTSEEFTLDDDQPASQHEAVSDGAGGAGSSDSMQPVGVSGDDGSAGNPTSVSDVSTTDGDLVATEGPAHATAEPAKPASENKGPYEPGPVDPFTTSVERLLALSHIVRRKKGYLKQIKNEVAKVSKEIKEGEERILILTEEMSYQLDLDPSDLESLQQEHEADQSVDETQEDDATTEVEEESASGPKPTADDDEPTPGTNRIPKSVAVVSDIREKDELLVAAGQIVEVADQDGDELIVYPDPKSDETIVLNPGEYEVEEWEEVADDPDDEEPDDEDPDGDITWKSLKLSEHNISALFDIGIRSPFDLAGKTVNDLTAASGIGPKKAAKILKLHEKAAGKEVEE